MVAADATKRLAYCCSIDHHGVVVVGHLIDRAWTIADVFHADLGRGAGPRITLFTCRSGRQGEHSGAHQSALENISHHSPPQSLVNGKEPHAPGTGCEFQTGKSPLRDFRFSAGRFEFYDLLIELDRLQARGIRSVPVGFRIDEVILLDLAQSPPRLVSLG